MESTEIIQNARNELGRCALELVAHTRAILRMLESDREINPVAFAGLVELVQDETCTISVTAGFLLAGQSMAPQVKS